MDSQVDLLPDNLFNESRNEIIPGWIKLFSWLFLVLGAFACLGFVFELFGVNFSIALYGLSTEEPLSLIGIVLSAIFIYKGVVAYAILKKTDIAITLGLVDAIGGIAICFGIMLYPLVYPGSNPGGFFRLELVALVPYLLKLKKIKSLWENAGYK